MRRNWIVMAGLLLVLPLYGQHDASKDGKKTNPAMNDPVAIASGKKLFVNSCAGCHGANGQGGRGPNLRQRGVWHPLDDDDLFRTISKGVPGADMPATNLPEGEVWKIAAFVKSLTTPAAGITVPGSPEAGEQVYAKAGCANCHRILARGGMLGPDLSNIGALKAVEDLRESILDPDADGFLRYKGITAVLKDGRTVKGIARNRDNYSIQLQDAQGNLHLLKMADVKDISISPHSPMPRNYKERLSAKELEDLIAFLSKQSVRPYEAPEKK